MKILSTISSNMHDSGHAATVCHDSRNGTLHMQVPKVCNISLEFTELRSVRMCQRMLGRTQAALDGLGAVPLNCWQTLTT